jgi:hypothetical protein
MYNLSILSIFRNSSDYLQNYINNVKKAFAHNGGKCHAIWLEGDSADTTLQMLEAAKKEMENENITVTLVKYDLGLPHSGGDHPERWFRLGNCWNRCLDELKPSDYTVCVESDLMWQPSIIAKLCREVNEQRNVVFPMLMRHYPFDNQFHDTHGFTRNGSNFTNGLPFWRVAQGMSEDENWLEITTGGGMIVSKYDYQKLGKFGLHDCIMHYPENVKLFMSKNLKIYHPPANSGETEVVYK